MLATENTFQEKALSSYGKYYAEYGYVVVPNLVSTLEIGALLDLYRRQIAPSHYPFFRQNTNAYEPNRLTGSGYVRQSFLDIHDYQRYSEFSRQARNIFCSDSILNALREITSFENFNLMQTMLFDLNAATPAHQDWYYLDSIPNGHLTAAWIALEDIDERAGRFYVVPGSQQLDFGAKLEGRTHAAWLQEVRNYVESRPQQVIAPPLRCGDVLFWNSRTVHGSLPTQDEKFSRKSLTAHYLPSQFSFGNIFSTKSDIHYKEHQGVRFYRNQPDYSILNRVKFFVKTKAYNYPRLREGLRAARRLFY